MKRLLLLLCLILRSMSAAGTAITDSVYLADDSTAPVGSYIVVSWPRFTTPSGHTVPAGKKTVNLAADGSFTVNLEPTDVSIPGFVYTAEYHVIDAAAPLVHQFLPTFSEYWTVPTSASPKIIQQLVSSGIVPVIGQVRLISKGDTVAFDGTNPVRVAAGADGTVLTADSTQTSGVAYKGITAAALPAFTGGDTHTSAGSVNMVVDRVGGQTAADVAASTAAVTGLIVNVRTFGALGNGSHDDTAAINAALTAAGPTGKVLVPYSANAYMVCGVNMQVYSKLIGYGSTLRANAANCTVLNIPANGSAGGFQSSSKLTVQDITIDGNNLSGTTGISIQNHSKIDFKNVDVTNCATVGLYLYAAQFGEYSQVHLVGNYVGVKIYSDLTAGGGNANTFYGLHVVNSGAVGVLVVCPPLGISQGGNVFVNPTMNNNTVAAFAMFGANSFASQAAWYGGNPEGNAKPAAPASVTIDGYTVKRAVVYLSHSNMTLDGVQEEDAQAQAGYVIEGGSVLTLASVAGFGQPASPLVQADSSSNVVFSGDFGAIGMVNNATNYPSHLTGQSSFQITGSPTSLPDTKIHNDFAGNPYSPSLTVQSVSSGPTLATDAQMGTVPSVAFAATPGTASSNNLGWFTTSITSSVDAIISVLLKSSTTSTFQFGVYGHAQGVFTLSAGKWTRVLWYAANLPSGTTNKVLLYPADSLGATVSVSRIEVLYTAAGSQDSQLYDSAVSAQGVFGTNGFSLVPPTIQLASAASVSSPGSYTANATAGAFTLTLPSASLYAGQTFSVSKNESSGNVVTVASSGGAIGPSSTILLPYNGASITVTSDGANWQIISQSVGTGSLLSYNSGKWGFGTTNPFAALSVVYNSGGVDSLSIQNTNGAGQTSLKVLDSAGALQGRLGYSNSSGSSFYPNTLYLGANGTTDLVLIYGSGSSEGARLTHAGLFNIGGNTSPVGAFSVGATSQFQISSAGNVSTTGSVNFTASSATSPFQSGLTASKPATCGVSQMYYATDATAGQNIYGCTATNTWTQQGGSGGSSTTTTEASRTITASATALTTDSMIYCDATTAAVTITLPNSSNGRLFKVKKIDTSANNCNVTPASGQIEFTTSVALSSQGATAKAGTNGTNWYLQ